MPSGDPQRTWFPEMVVRLQSEWHEGVSMPALISLRDELECFGGFGPAATSRHRLSLVASVGQRVGQQNPTLVCVP